MRMYLYGFCIHNYMAERKYDYEKYLSNSKRLNNFLDLYKDRAATCRAYKRHLVKYFSEMGIEDVDNYVKDTRQLDKKEKIEYLDGIERDLRKYWIDLNKETRGKTPYVWLSAIKMFLIMNKSLELDDVYISLQKSGHGNYAVTETKTPTKEELLKIFSYSNPESKALFMFQLTSGQRIEQVMETTFDNIDMRKDCPRIYYPQAKQKYWVKTRITPEAKKILQDYLEQKDKFIAIREKRGESNRAKELNKDRLFCMNVSTANHMWTVMVKNAGLYKLDSKTGRPHYGTHCLRRYFLTHFGDETWGDFFSGHITARNKEYRKYSDERLDQEYIKHKDDLNIFENTDHTEINKEITNLKEENRKLRDRLQDFDFEMDKMKKMLREDDKKNR
jgi:integrase